jgi:hypothetical protein
LKKSGENIVQSTTPAAEYDRLEITGLGPSNVAIWRIFRISTNGNRYFVNIGIEMHGLTFAFQESTVCQKLSPESFPVKNPEISGKM